LMHSKPNANGSFACLFIYIPSGNDDLIVSANLSKSTSIPCGRILVTNNN